MKIFSYGENGLDIGEATVSTDGRSGYIDYIRVVQKGQGIGTEILVSLEKQLIDYGVEGIYGIIGEFEDTDPQKLRRFYEKNGYKIVDMGDVPTIEKEVNRSDIPTHYQQQNQNSLNI